jgi:hypothetical protein
MRLGFRVFLLAGVAFLSACATLPMPPPAPPSPDVLLYEVRLRREVFQGLKGLAWVRVDSPQSRFRVQEVLLVQRPGLLRMETLGPLGTPQLYLVTDGQEVSIYHPGENRYFRGPYAAHSLPPPLALPFRLKSEEIVSFLLGIPLLRDPVQTSVTRDLQKGLWVLEMASAGQAFQQTLWIRPQPFAILRGEVHLPEISYQYSFSDFQTVNGLEFPHKLSLDAPSSETRIRVEYGEIELNPSWEAKDFSLPPPRGAVIVPLH